MKTAQEIAKQAFPGESLTDLANAEGLQREIEKHAVNTVKADRAKILSDYTIKAEGSLILFSRNFDSLPLPFQEML